MRSRRAGGFSLIEVLVAFMVLAISLSVLFRVFSGGLRNVAVTEGYSRALMLAQSRLASAGISEPLQAGESTGEWGGLYHWRQVVEDYDPWAGQEDEPPAPAVPAYVVTVEVSWEQDAKLRRVSLQSVRLVLPEDQQAGAG